uniref:RRM domain-containing protein n=1 Tax=Parastrongyloides trichosuri TaxID=131310 RepID=A0A0N4ZBZ1_PARTI
MKHRTETLSQQPSRHLQVGPLYHELSEEKVKLFFEKLGNIEKVKKVANSTSFIISFENLETAEEILKNRDLFYEGKYVEVEYSHIEESDDKTSKSSHKTINRNGKANGFERHKDSKHNDHHSKSRVNRSTSRSPKHAESHHNILKDKSHNKMHHSENNPTTSKDIDKPISPSKSLIDGDPIVVFKGKLSKEARELYQTSPCLRKYRSVDIYCHSASRILYVTFTSSSISEYDVKRQFSQFGAILDITIVKFPNNAYALIEYDCMRSVADAIEVVTEVIKKHNDFSKNYEPFHLMPYKANWGRTVFTNSIWLEFLPTGVTKQYLSDKLSELFKDTFVELHFHGVKREAVVVFDNGESATSALSAFKNSTISINPFKNNDNGKVACDYCSPKNLDVFISKVNKLHHLIDSNLDVVVGNDDNSNLSNLPSQMDPPPRPPKSIYQQVSSEDESSAKKSKRRKSSSTSPYITSTSVSSGDDTDLDKKEHLPKKISSTSSIENDERSVRSQNVLKRKLPKYNYDDFDRRDYRKPTKKYKIIGGAIPVSPVSRSSKDNTPRASSCDSELSGYSSRTKYSSSRRKRKSKSKRSDDRNYDKHSSYFNANTYTPSINQHSFDSGKSYYESSRRRRYYDSGRYRDYSSYKSRDDYRSNYDRKENSDRVWIKEERRSSRDDRGDSYDKEPSKNQDDKKKKRDRKSKKYKKSKDKHRIKEEVKESDYKKHSEHSKSSNRISDKHANHKEYESTSSNLHDTSSDKTIKSHVNNTSKDEKRLSYSKSHVRDKGKETDKSDKIEKTKYVYKRAYNKFINFINFRLPPPKKSGPTSISGAEEISDTDEEEQQIVIKEEIVTEEKIDDKPIIGTINDETTEEKKEDKEIESLNNISISSEELPPLPEGSPSLSKEPEGLPVTPVPPISTHSDEILPTHIHPYNADRLLTECMEYGETENKEYMIPDYIYPPLENGDSYEDVEEVDESCIEEICTINEDEVDEDLSKAEEGLIVPTESEASKPSNTEIEIYDEFDYSLYKGKKYERTITYVELPPLSPVPEYNVSMEYDNVYQIIKNEVNNKHKCNSSCIETKIFPRGIKKVDMNPNSRYNAEEISEILRGRELKYDCALDNINGCETSDKEEEITEEIVEEVEQLNPDGTKKTKTLPRFHPIKNKALAFSMYGKFISESTSYRHKFVTFMNAFSDFFNQDDILDDYSICQNVVNDEIECLYNIESLYDRDSILTSDDEYSDRDEESINEDLYKDESFEIKEPEISNKEIIQNDSINNDVTMDESINEENIKDENELEEDPFAEDLYPNINLEDEPLALFNSEKLRISYINGTTSPSPRDEEDLCKIKTKQYSGYDIKDTTPINKNVSMTNEAKEEINEGKMEVDEFICDIKIDENKVEESDTSIITPFIKSTYKTPTVSLQDLYEATEKETEEERVEVDKLLQGMIGGNCDKLTLLAPYYSNSSPFKELFIEKIDKNSNNEHVIIPRNVDEKISTLGIATGKLIATILPGDINYKYIDTYGNVCGIGSSEETNVDNYDEDCHDEEENENDNDSLDSEISGGENDISSYENNFQDLVENETNLEESYDNQDEDVSEKLVDEKESNKNEEECDEDSEKKPCSDDMELSTEDVVTVEDNNDIKVSPNVSEEESLEAYVEAPEDIQEDSLEEYTEALEDLSDRNIEQQENQINDKFNESSEKQVIEVTNNDNEESKEEIIPTESNHSSNNAEQSNEVTYINLNKRIIIPPNAEEDDDIYEGELDMEREAQRIARTYNLTREELAYYYVYYTDATDRLPNDEALKNYGRYYRHPDQENPDESENVVQEMVNEEATEEITEKINEYNIEYDEEIVEDEEYVEGEEDGASSEENYEQERYLPQLLTVQEASEIVISKIDANIGLSLNTMTDEFDECIEDENIEIVPDEKEEERDITEDDIDSLPINIQEINDVPDDKSLIVLLQNTFKRNYDGLGEDILYGEPLYKRRKLEIIPSADCEIDVEDQDIENDNTILSVALKHCDKVNDNGNEDDDKLSAAECDSVTSSEYHTSDLEYLSAEENYFNFDVEYLEKRRQEFENETADNVYTTNVSCDDISHNSLNYDSSHYNLQPPPKEDPSENMSSDNINRMEVEDGNENIDNTTIPSECIEVPSLAPFTTESADVISLSEVPENKKCIKRYYVKTRLEVDDSDSEEANYENYEIFIKDSQHLEELKKSNVVVEDNQVICGDGSIRLRTEEDLPEYLARKERIHAQYATTDSVAQPILNNDSNNMSLSNENDSHDTSNKENNKEVTENCSSEENSVSNNVISETKTNGGIPPTPVVKKEVVIEQMLIDEAPDKEAIEALNALVDLDDKDRNDEPMDDETFLLDDIEDPSDFVETMENELLGENIEKLLDEDVSFDAPILPKKIKRECVDESKEKSSTVVNGFTNEENNVQSCPEETTIDNENKEVVENEIIIKEEVVEEDEKSLKNITEINENEDEKNKENKLDDNQQDDMDLNDNERSISEENPIIETPLSLKTENISSPILPLNHNIVGNVLTDKSLKNVTNENGDAQYIQNNDNTEKDDCNGKENIVQQNGYNSLPPSNKENKYKLYVNTFGITFVNGNVLFELANANCLTSCPRICLQLKKWLCKLNLFYINGMKEILNDFIVTHTHPNIENPKNRNIVISKKVVSKEYYENIMKHVLNSSPYVLNLICGASGYNREDYMREENRLNRILNYCEENGLYSGLFWQSAVSDYVAFFIPSCDILDDQFKAAQPQAFCKKPRRYNLLRTLHSQFYWKCFITTIMVDLCLGYSIWCSLNPNYFPIKIGKIIISNNTCSQGYHMIPIGFAFLLYIIYLMECWHTKIKKDKIISIDMEDAKDYMAKLQMATPIVWWKSICYHYLRRTRQITRYRNGDAFTATQVYYERFNSHTAGNVFQFDQCGVKDISRTVHEINKYKVIKIRFSKGFVFACSQAADEFEEQRARFFNENESKDDYMEVREGLDLAGCVFEDEVLAYQRQKSGFPWYMKTPTYWIASVLLLSWPLRVICDYNTAHLSYRVTKLFGSNYLSPSSYNYTGPLTRTSTMESRELERAAQENYVLVPSYSEAMLLEPVLSNNTFVTYNNQNFQNSCVQPSYYSIENREANHNTNENRRHLPRVGHNSLRFNIQSSRLPNYGSTNQSFVLDIDEQNHIVTPPRSCSMTFTSNKNPTKIELLSTKMRDKTMKSSMSALRSYSMQAGLGTVEDRKLSRNIELQRYDQINDDRGNERTPLVSEDTTKEPPPPYETALKMSTPIVQKIKKSATQSISSILNLMNIGESSKSDAKQSTSDSV